MNIYSADFAALYDRTGRSAGSECLAERLIQQFDSQYVLDLACGTGAAALAFATAGRVIVGVDSSAAMLAQARFKAEQRGLDIPFIQSDIRALTSWKSAPLRPSWFDLITCLGGSLNELIANDDLERFAAGVRHLLRPGGWFVGDLTLPAEYRHWGQRDDVLYNDHDYLVYQRLSYDFGQELGLRRSVWLVREIETWWRGEETHSERAWSAEALHRALRGAGEAGLHVQEQTGDEPGGRIIIQACKNP
jgi:SAM-dependent methyltransferase